jgi:hypothetical protein
MIAYVVDALVLIHFYQELSILRFLQQCGLVGESDKNHMHSTPLAGNQAIQLL